MLSFRSDRHVLSFRSDRHVLEYAERAFEVLDFHVYDDRVGIVSGSEPGSAYLTPASASRSRSDARRSAWAIEPCGTAATSAATMSTAAAKANAHPRPPG